MPALRRTFVSAGLGLVSVLALAPQCSSNSEDDEQSEPLDSGNAGGGSDAGAESASTTTAQTTGSVNLDTGSSGSTPVGCAGETTEAVPIPLDIYFMVDVSGSMLDSVSDTVTKWQAVRQALQNFFQGDALPSVRVALGFFPQRLAGVPNSCTEDAQCSPAGPCLLRTCWNYPDGLIVPCASDSECFFENALGVPVDTGPCSRFGACVEGEPNLAEVDCIQQCADDGSDCLSLASICLNDADCSADAYAQPTVAMAPLSDSVDTLVAALDSVEPDGGTPTAPALSGAISHLSELAAQGPDRGFVTVLATDGFPSEDCAGPDIVTLDDAAIEVAEVAAAGFAGTPSISTFVIGVFSPAEAVDAERLLGYIAEGGGTSEAFIVETTGNVSAEFSAALSQIQNAAITCDFEIPEPTSGTVNYGQVNVQLGSGQDTTTLFYVDSVDACSSDGGWYYDTPPAADSTPSRITLCDTSCEAFKSGGAAINIRLGCETVIK